MDERSVPQSSGVGLFRDDDPAGPTARHSLGDVVAWCLTVAAVVSIVGAVADIARLPGIKLADRVAQFPLGALYPLALVLAAAVALVLTGAGSRARGYRGDARAIAVGSLAVSAAVATASSAYTIAVFLLGKRVGTGSFDVLRWTARIPYMGIAIACGLVGAGALYALVSERRGASRAVDAPDHAIAPPSRRMLDPVVAGLFGASIVLIFEIANSVFATGGRGIAGPSFFGGSAALGVDRLRVATSAFNELPLAFVMVAIVVLVALSARRDARNGVSDLLAVVAGLIGVAALASGVFEALDALTVDASSSRGRLILFGLGGWQRVSIAAPALASAVLGAAAGYLYWRLRSSGPADRANTRSPFDPRVAGLALVGAGLGSAGFVVAPIVQGARGYAVGDILVAQAGSILLTVGLSLAAVIVMVSSAREPNDEIGRARDPRRVVVDAVATVIGVATVATSAFVIVYVLIHHDPVVDTGGVTVRSLLSEASNSQKVSYCAVALANAPVAAALLRLLWSSGHPDDPDEPDAPGDQIPVVDLLP